MNARDLLQAEKQWHENLYRGRQDYEFVVPPKVRARYSSRRRYPLFPLELMFQMVGEVRGKKVLSFGCGDENLTILLALMGADVYAFDLSYEAIGLQKRMAAANHVEDRVHAVVCAAEELPFLSGRFDIVFGSAILHHLPDALSALASELARVLHRSGFALFSEPVALNRLLKAIVSRLPGQQELSPRERQLTGEDFLSFARLFRLETYPFAFLSRLDRFIYRGALEHAAIWKKITVYALHVTDYLMLRMPFCNRLAAVLVLKMNPI